MTVLQPLSFTSSTIFSSTKWAVAVLVTFGIYSITSKSAHDYDHLIFSSQRFLNMFKRFLPEICQKKVESRGAEGEHE